MDGSISILYVSPHDGAHIKKLALIGAVAPCFTKREDFPYSIDKLAVDDLIRQTYEDRPSMLRNFSEIFFAAPEKLSPEFKIWNLGLGLAASSYATIQCAIELRDADLRKDLANIQVPALIVHGANDRYADLIWPKLCMRISKVHSLYKLKKLVMVFTLKNARELTQSLSSLLASYLFLSKGLDLWGAATLEMTAML